MKKQHATVLALIAVACMGLASSAQGPQRRASSPGSYTAPRNAFGQPDFEGVWTNNSLTPLQRPEAWADKATLTDEELKQVQAATRQLEEKGDALFGDELISDVLAGKKESESHDTETGNYNSFWLPNRHVDNRTSLIIDPPNGRIPALTPEARARQAARA